MFRLFLFVGCVLSSSSLLAGTDQCQALGKGIKVLFPQGLPQFVQADTTVSIPVKITVAEPSLLKPFRSAPVLLLLSNKQLGAHKFNEFFFLKNTTSTDTNFAEDFQFSVHFGSNTFGYYQFEAQLAFYDEANGVCSAQIQNISHDFISVINDPANADSHAPILTSVTTEKSEFVIGEEVVVRFKALDKSDICTADLVEQKTCETVGHISMVDMATGLEVGAYPKAPIRDGDSYTLSFSASSDEGFKPGQYKIKGINVDDVWGNGNHNIAESIQAVFELK